MVAPNALAEVDLRRTVDCFGPYHHGTGRSASIGPRAVPGSQQPRTPCAIQAYSTLRMHSNVLRAGYGSRSGGSDGSLQGSEGQGAPFSELGFRPSDFLRISAFGFRISPGLHRLAVGEVRRALAHDHFAGLDAGN